MEHSKHFREAGVPGLCALTENNPLRNHTLVAETVAKLPTDMGPGKKIADKDEWFPFQLKNSKQEAQIHISDCSRTTGKAVAAEPSKKEHGNGSQAWVPATAGGR